MEESLRDFKSKVVLNQPSIEKYEKIIPKLLENIDYSRLLEKSRYEELERIRKNYDRNDVFIVDVIDKILKVIKCSKCSEFYIYKHHCGGFICRNCAQNNNYTCLYCKHPLPHSMIRHFYNLSLSCMECCKPTVPGTGPECGHFCESCLFEGSSEQFYFKQKSHCETCLQYFSSHQFVTHSCSSCSDTFYRSQGYQLCELHLCCISCSTALIETGKCSCGAVLPVSKVQQIYEKTHFACASCNYCFPLRQRHKGECGCNRDICSICLKLTCDICTTPTLNLLPS